MGALPAALCAAGQMPPACSLCGPSMERARGHVPQEDNAVPHNKVPLASAERQAADWLPPRSPAAESDGLVVFGVKALEPEADAQHVGLGHAIV